MRLKKKSNKNINANCIWLRKTLKYLYTYAAQTVHALLPCVLYRINYRVQNCSAKHCGGQRLYMHSLYVQQSAGPVGGGKSKAY